MEVCVVAGSQVSLGRADDSGLCSFSRNVVNLKNESYLKRFDFNRGGRDLRFSKSAASFCLKASASAQVEPVVSDKASGISRSSPNDSVKLFVGLPFDTISISNTLNHERAIGVGLKALKLLGVEGVELPVWWGVVENEAHSKYNWIGYLKLVEMAKKVGLKVHVSLCFHGSQEPKIPLPKWVENIGSSNSSIYFKDRSGHCYPDCLSFSVDQLPVLDGKTPLEVYAEFCESFKSSFSSFLGSTITGVSIGLGPDGELKYPSVKLGKNRHCGGEFQCYDDHMLAELKQSAEKTGNPLWGLGGPHDAPSHNCSPFYDGFFAENGGSWETPYGQFFLSWYSNQLIHHGDRILSLAASAFKDTPLTLSGRIPLMHSSYNSRSHPSELAAGFYNTISRDGYDAVVEMFSRHSCTVVVPGFDLSDEGSRSRPEALLLQILSCCKRHGVEVSGQNSSVSGCSQMNKNLLGGNSTVSTFFYQRMGAYFFSPEHFPAFSRFVRGLSGASELHDSRW